jgi:hypothetical protein
MQQQGMMASFTTGSEVGQQMWSDTTGMQGNGYWDFSATQSPMNQATYTQDPYQMQHSTMNPEAALMQQNQVMHQMNLQQQMMPMNPAEQCLPQMQMPQMEVAQTPICITSADSTPSEIDRCMSIVMPQANQFPCDNDMMAAQLRAVADNQCYED